MAFEIASVTGQVTQADEFPQTPTRVLNFTGTGFTCTRGTGEQSNVVTIELTPAVPPATASPWNSTNEAPTDSWAFSEDDFLADMTAFIP